MAKRRGRRGSRKSTKQANGSVPDSVVSLLNQVEVTDSSSGSSNQSLIETTVFTDPNALKILTSIPETNGQSRPSFSINEESKPVENKQKPIITLRRSARMNTQAKQYDVQNGVGVAEKKSKSILKTIDEESSSSILSDDDKSRLGCVVPNGQTEKKEKQKQFSRSPSPSLELNQKKDGDGETAFAAQPTSSEEPRSLNAELGSSFKPRSVSTAVVIKIIKVPTTSRIVPTRTPTPVPWAAKKSSVSPDFVNDFTEPLPSTRDSSRLQADTSDETIKSELIPNSLNAEAKDTSSLPKSQVSSEEPQQFSLQDSIEMQRSDECSLQQQSNVQRDLSETETLPSQYATAQVAQKFDQYLRVKFNTYMEDLKDALVRKAVHLRWATAFLNEISVPKNDLRWVNPEVLIQYMQDNPTDFTPQVIITILENEFPGTAPSLNSTSDSGFGFDNSTGVAGVVSKNSTAFTSVADFDLVSENPTASTNTTVSSSSESRSSAVAKCAPSSSVCLSLPLESPNGAPKHQVDRNDSRKEKNDQPRQSELKHKNVKSRPSTRRSRLDFYDYHNDSSDESDENVNNNSNVDAAAVRTFGGVQAVNRARDRNEGGREGYLITRQATRSFMAKNGEPPSKRPREKH